MNATEQTKAEVAHFGVVERYISDLRSKSSSLTDHEFTLIAGNIRGFYATAFPFQLASTATTLLADAERAIEEYSCNTPVSHIATEMEGLAARIRAFLSGKPVQTSDVKKRLTALHTPGPWEVGPVDDTVVTHVGVDGTRYEIAAIDGDYNSPDEWPTMEANAHLIAAAPDMLSALEHAREKMWAYGFSENDLLPIREAIAKAVQS